MLRLIAYVFRVSGVSGEFYRRFSFLACGHWAGLVKYNRFYTGITEPDGEKISRQNNPVLWEFPEKRKSKGVLSETRPTSPLYPSTMAISNRRN
jgi:hypothetical protein